MINRLLLIAVAALVALCTLPCEVAAFGVSRGAESRVSRPSSTTMYAAKKASTKKSSAKKSSKKAAASEEEEVVNFKKAEFVSALAEKTGMTKADSDIALAAVLNVIATEVSAGKRIALPGFGTFKLNYRAARKGRNPKTGEEIDIKASYSPSFSASKTFKEMANPDR
mmetsp:Transcript_12683/g.24772  ORF Transcript_12683/g.24772 Transcript_12683/m.24772 type:complete len:168 (-) Transcript_12683:402-905(-)